MAGFNKVIVDTTISKQSLTIQQVETYDKGEIHLNLADGTPSNQTFSGISTDPVENRVTLLSHGFVDGARVQFTTTNTLPDGLDLATDYYVIAESSNTIKLANSYDNAVAGVEIDILDEGIGTHTIVPATLGTVQVYVEKSGDRSNFQKVIEVFDVDIANSPLILSLEDLVLPHIRLGVEITSGQVDLQAIVYLKSYIN